MIPKTVRLNEVGPRDGLQSEPNSFSIQNRIDLIDGLTETGIRAIEIGSFVSPRWVPKMADTDQVAARIQPRAPVVFQALAPNLRGLEAAHDASIREVSVFPAASESFSQRNLNQPIDVVMERVAEVTARAKTLGIRVRGCVSCAWYCPFEGRVEPEMVRALAARQIELGCYEVSLADTIGTATPGEVASLFDFVAESVPRAKLAAHFHDTYGQALANIYAALQRGIAVIDSSVAGLGGCPYAPGATGNVSSEDVVYMLDGLGIDSGVTLDRLIEVGNWISSILGRPSQSKVAHAMAAKRERQ